MFVWLIWAASTFIPVYTTSIYGPRLSYSDDWNLVPSSRDTGLTLFGSATQ